MNLQVNTSRMPKRPVSPNIANSRPIQLVGHELEAVAAAGALGGGVLPTSRS